MIKLALLVVFLIVSNVKIAREWGQSIFVFGDEDQTNWNLTLAKKRLQEADILKGYGMNSMADQKIQQAQNYQKQACVHFTKVVNRVDVNYLIDEMNQLKLKC